MDIFDYIFEHYPFSTTEFEKLKQLIKAGTFLCSVNEMLLYAGYCDINYIQFLLEEGADINYQTDDSGKTPLIHLIHHADEQHALKLIQYLLDQGANPNLGDFEGDTALHRSIIAGHYQQMKILLEHGADPNIQNDSGTTPLIYAVLLEPLPLRLRYVSCLLKYGANPNIRDDHNFTAIDYAKERNYEKIVQILI